MRFFKSMLLLSVFFVSCEMQSNRMEIEPNAQESFINDEGAVLGSSPTRDGSIFSDPDLEETVRRNLGIEDGVELTQDHLNQLVDLKSVNGLEINTFEGLENCPNIRSIYIGGWQNSVTSLAPLKNLPLESLILEQVYLSSRIKDLTPLIPDGSEINETLVHLQIPYGDTHWDYTIIQNFRNLKVLKFEGRSYFKNLDFLDFCNDLECFGIMGYNQYHRTILQDYTYDYAANSSCEELTLDLSGLYQLSSLDLLRNVPNTSKIVLTADGSSSTLSFSNRTAIGRRNLEILSYLNEQSVIVEDAFGRVIEHSPVIMFIDNEARRIRSLTREDNFSGVPIDRDSIAIPRDINDIEYEGGNYTVREQNQRIVVFDKTEEYVEIRSFSRYLGTASCASKLTLTRSQVEVSSFLNCDFELADSNGNGVLDLYIFDRLAPSEEGDIDGTTNLRIIPLSHSLYTIGDIRKIDNILHRTNTSHYDWEVSDFNGDNVPDYYLIKRKNEPGHHRVNLFIFSGTDPSIRLCSSPLPDLCASTLADIENRWEFELADYDMDGMDDLFFIKKDFTGTQTTEIHIFSGEDKGWGHYRTALWRVGTQIPRLGNDDSNWDFVLSY